MILVAAADPADAVGIVEAVLLLAVGVAAAGLDHLAEVRHHRPVPGGVAVVVGIEHAGHAVLPQQDQGVGQGLEPVRDEGLQTLPVLGVVVVDEADRVRRAGADQGVVQDAPHIVIRAGLGRVEKVVVQGHVKEGHLVFHRVEIVQQAAQIAAPVFAYRRQGRMALLAQALQQLPVEGEADVLDRVEAQPVHAGLLQIPAQPFFGLALHGGVRHVDVHSHQIVEVALFGVGLRGPALAGKAVDAVAAFGILVPVRAGEVPVVPDEVAVRAVPAREGEFRPDMDRVLPVHLVGAVVGAVADGPDGLQLVAAHAVVEHDISVDADVGRVEGVHRRDIFVLGSVFGPDGSLLVELAQIV